jgi:hypothetical protein
MKFLEGNPRNVGKPATTMRLMSSLFLTPNTLAFAQRRRLDPKTQFFGCQWHRSPWGVVPALKA